MTQSGPKTSVAILVSGGGSNLQAFIDAVSGGDSQLNIAVVFSNNPQAFALERARKAGIAVECISHADYAEREDFDAAVAGVLDSYDPDLLILAGFMRILSAPFVQRYEGRILNIHPSLLPLYPGLHTHQRALDSGDEWHGATVHFVTEELDGGPPIIQGRVPVLNGDDAESLAARVLKVEHRIYPEAARLIASGRVRYAGGKALIDGEPHSSPLQFDATG